MNAFFRQLAEWCSDKFGSAPAFAIAILSVLIWLALGPTFRWSNLWQLTYNTALAVVTFLMVFLIQNAQNRSDKALHLKLDELLRTHEKSRNALIHLESLSDEELEQLGAEFDRLRQSSREHKAGAEPDQRTN